jgi:enamine deaminase RidA (YjgF/YER057c/UK114 family)
MDAAIAAPLSSGVRRHTRTEKPRNGYRRRTACSSWLRFAAAVETAAGCHSALPLGPNRRVTSHHLRPRSDQLGRKPRSALGKVGAEVTEEDAYIAARLTGLAILGSLKRELGSLERIACWSRAFGMVNSAPGFNKQPAVINGFTDLVISVFGQERGAHARSAVGLAELPFRIPVEIEAEVEIHRDDA